MKNLLFLALTSISLQAYAEEKYLFFMGAGGEPEGKTTIFDENIKSMAKFSQDPSWKTAVALNGKHSTTESIIKKKFNHARILGHFNKEGFDKTLADIRNKLQSDTLKSGDKFLIVIETHGARRITGQTTHSIALSGGEATNLETLQGAAIASLDRLQEIIQMAEEKKVPLAILDLSCYSGNTQRLVSKNTCIITSTGTDHPGYTNGWNFKLQQMKKVKTDFPGILIDSFEKGKNLEELFLNAKMMSQAPEFPTISTEAGSAGNKYFYELMLSLLKHERKLNGFTRQYGKTIAEFNTKVLEIKENYSVVENFLKGLEDSNALRMAMSKYRSFQEGYESAVDATLKIAGLAKNEIENKYPQDKQLFEKEDGLAILTSDYDVNLKAVESDLDRYRNNPPDYLRKDVVEIMINKKLAEISDIQKKKVIQAEMKKNFGSQYQEQVAKLNATYTELEIDKTFLLSEEVRKEAKKVYHAFYLKNRTQDNPCQKFTL